MKTTKNISKLIVVVFSVFFIQVSFARICVNASANGELFGGGVGTEALVRNADLAFYDSSFTDYQFFPTDSNAQLVNQIQRMVSDHCSVILGLVTSRECLIAGPLLKKNKTVGLSPSCGHDSVGNYYPYLFTGTHPISKAAQTTVEYLNRTSHVGKIYAIHQPTDIYGEAEFSEFIKRFHQPITKIAISSDGAYNLSQFTFKKNEDVTLLFFIYPLASVNMLVDLSSHDMINKHVRIVGASSWNDNALALKPVQSILKKARSAVASDVLDWKKVEQSHFAKMFERKFNRQPLNVEVLNYDITRFAVKCYRAAMVNHKYDRDKFEYCITHTQYHGVSGTFSFSKQSSFADRPMYMTNLLGRL